MQRNRALHHSLWEHGCRPPPRTDATHERDGFGRVWRADELPRVAVELPLKVPDFADCSFRSVDTFLNATVKADAKKRVDEWPVSLRIVGPGLWLWHSWCLRGFQSTLMGCPAEEDFYAELLDRKTELCVALATECADMPVGDIMMRDDWANQRGVMIGPE